MAYRLFENSKHASLYYKFRPVTPADVITKIICFLKEKYTSPLQHAIDTGCGSGQSTAILAPHFQKVTGIDISEAQISEASKNNTLPNVEYIAIPVEKIPLATGSLQLVSACQSCHWFDLPEFYKEVDRLLVPNGVLALYGYTLPLPIHSDETITKKAQKLVREFYDNEMEKYMSTQRVRVDNCYKDITLPYEDNIRTSVMSDMHCTIQDYYGYFTTWSGFQKFKAEEPEKATFALDRVYNRLKETLEANSPETPITLRMEYFILMGRKK